MLTHKHILKVGLAVKNSNCLLVVRKRGTSSYILPGGKPERNEDDVTTLVRELNEELGCRVLVESLVFLGTFSDVAADHKKTAVTVRLYAGKLVGEPKPQSEIEEIKWVDLHEKNPHLAPSLKNSIVPFLLSH